MSFLITRSRLIGQLLCSDEAASDQLFVAVNRRSALKQMPPVTTGPTGEADDECRGSPCRTAEPGRTDRPRQGDDPRDPGFGRGDGAQPDDLAQDHRKDPRCRTAADLPAERVRLLRI